MVYETNRKKTSAFTKATVVNLNDRPSGLQDGGNVTWDWQSIIDKVAEVYGASFRTYEFESELIASDIQLGELALVEENGYRVYKITNVVAGDFDLTLTSGYSATFQVQLQSGSGPGITDPYIMTNAVDPTKVLTLASDYITLDGNATSKLELQWDAVTIEADNAFASIIPTKVQVSDGIDEKNSSLRSSGLSITDDSGTGFITTIGGRTATWLDVDQSYEVEIDGRDGITVTDGVSGGFESNIKYDRISVREGASQRFLADSYRLSHSNGGNSATFNTFSGTYYLTGNSFTYNGEQVIVASDLVGGGSGDFLSSGLLPMTGDLNFSGAQTRRIEHLADDEQLVLSTTSSGSTRLDHILMQDSLSFQYNNVRAVEITNQAAGSMLLDRVGGQERVLTESDARTNKILNDSDHGSSAITLTSVLESMPKYALLVGHVLQNTQNNFFNSVVANGQKISDPDDSNSYVTMDIKCVVNATGTGDDVITSGALPVGWRPGADTSCILTQVLDSTNFFKIHCDVFTNGTMTLWQEVGSNDNGTYTGSISFLL